MTYNLQDFACARCGNCCRGEGYVRVTPADVSRMAAHLQMSVTEFIEKFTEEPEIKEQADAGDLWLKDKPGTEQDCIMLHNNLCIVHPAKPVQCVGFPMKWRTPDFMDYCEGMRK